MTNLKSETVNKCFSLLREYIEETSGVNNNKGVAVMALNQLERVTAGTREKPDSQCSETPLADGISSGLPTPICIEVLTADGAPFPGGG